MTLYVIIAVHGRKLLTRDRSIMNTNLCLVCLVCLVVSISVIHFLWYHRQWPHKASACSESTGPLGDKVSSI